MQKIIGAGLFLGIAPFKIYQTLCEDAVSQKSFVDIEYLHFCLKFFRIRKILAQRFSNNAAVRKVATTACPFLIQDEKNNEKPWYKTNEVEFEFS